MLRRPESFVWILCIVVAGAAAEPPINYLDPPQGTFTDDWMTVELSGQKAGYSHSTMSRKGDVISTRMLTLFKIGRANQSIEITVRQSTTETLDGRPLTFETMTDLGTVEMATRGKIEQGVAKITSTQFGFDTEQTGEVPDGSKMAWGLFRESIERGFEPGTKYETSLYEPSLQVAGPVTAKVIVGEREVIDYLGKPHDATKVTTTLSMGVGSVDSVGYVDKDGQVLKATTAMAGFEMTMTAVDRETALADFSAPEFFMDTLVRVDREIDRDVATKIVYQLRATEPGQKIPQLPETPMQKPGERSDRSSIVEVRRLDHQALKSAEFDVPSAALNEYLAASPAINSKDELVIKMAEKAAGDATTPYAIADRLRIYVTDAIKTKNLNIGFATASEVCRNREGDCTEHAVLLAALGRAKRIPSRVVVGLAYVPQFVGVQNVFGFHMWTQFYIGGQWVDFDAALHETDCSPTRIALATSSLKDASIGDIAFAIMDVIHGLKIDVKNVETR